jgi:6-phosphofructokinase 1
VLLPEFPYDVERVAAKVRERASYGLRFTIVVIGEGAHPQGGAASEIEPAHSGRLQRLGGAADRLAHALTERSIGHDVRVTVLGHLQRGGTPTAADRLLATRFGVHAAQLCAEGRYGRMVCLRGGHVDSMPIIEACRAPSRVDPDGELVRCAREMGIELGV